VDVPAELPQGADLAALSDDFTDTSSLALWDRFEPMETDGAGFESLTVEPAGIGVLRAVPTASVCTPPNGAPRSSRTSPGTWR